MELVHWLFIIFGIALALTTQWCLLAPFSLEWKRCATKLLNRSPNRPRCSKSALQGSTPRPSLPAGSARLQSQAL